MSEDLRIPGENSRGWARWKFIMGFLGIIIGVLGIYMSWQAYQFYSQSRAVEKLAQELERTEREAYARAREDTYGGATPQETLRMYIEAVEAGDYELASKYFVEEKREEEKKILQETRAKGNADFLLSLAREIQESNGIFSSDAKIYTIKTPAFAEFVLYPSGIWKIIEI